MLKDHEARVKFRTGKMWDDLHLRPLFRAIHGQANTLRKMGRYREALAKYLLLEKYDSNWYTTRYGNSVPVLPMAHRTHRIRPHTAHRATAPPRHRATQSHVRQLPVPHAGRVPGPGQHRSRLALPRQVGRAGLLPQLHQYARSHAPHTAQTALADQPAVSLYRSVLAFHARAAGLQDVGEWGGSGLGRGPARWASTFGTRTTRARRR
jgi:hypothetical protein